MPITLLQPDGLVRSPAFSHVAVVPPGATTVYLGGQNGVDETGRVVSDDIAAQSVRAVENAKFDPKLVNGQAVASTLKRRIEFNLSE